MRLEILGKLGVVGTLALAWLGLSAGSAGAVPAFAVQTGEACQNCHVGGFGPQLTPFGREFKLNGYTLRTAKFNVPLSAMVVASYLHTQKDQTPPPTHFSSNNNVALDQFSLFFAGGFGDHFGAFVQGTYDGVAQQWHWDNLDLRAVIAKKFGKADVTFGADLNNAPTVEDAWNTTPAWGFPFTTSTLAPVPSTSPLLDGALAQTSLGTTLYAWINSEFYLEGGAYWSPGAGLLTGLGVDPTAPGAIDGAAPYGRFAFQHDAGPGVLEVGAFALAASIHPGLDYTTGMTDHYTDAGLDGSYQVTLPSTDVVSADARYTHENQQLDASCALALGPPGCADNALNEFRFDASYYYRNKVGLTLAVLNLTGNANPTIYAANRTMKPDSTAFMAQLDGTPWGDGKGPLGQRFNTRIGIQYTNYVEFNGAVNNWDGAGSNARDNNVVRLFVWAAY
jgi:hypothetical protein